MDRQQKDKEELIELFGTHFHRYHNLPPLAGTILAILIVNKRLDGMTFNEILEITQASKSSVSTNLNLLLKAERIVYYTKCGERKKYFKPSSLVDRMSNHIKVVEAEIKLIKKLKNYDVTYNTTDATDKYQKASDAYLLYMEQFLNVINTAAEQLAKIEQEK